MDIDEFTFRFKRKFGKLMELYAKATELVEYPNEELGISSGVGKYLEKRCVNN